MYSIANIDTFETLMLYQRTLDKLNNNMLCYALSQCVVIVLKIWIIVYNLNRNLELSAKGGDLAKNRLSSVCKSFIY